MSFVTAHLEVFHCTHHSVIPKSDLCMYFTFCSALMHCLKEHQSNCYLKFCRTSKNGLNSDYFAKNAHKIAKSKYFPDILNDSDSAINSLSDDM